MRTRVHPLGPCILQSPSLTSSLCCDVQVPAFVSGGVLPTSQRGQTHAGLIAIADWHVTLCTLAGVDPADGEPNAPSPLDGMDAWAWISGRVPHSSRTELVYDHHMFRNVSTNASQPCHVAHLASGEARCVQGAMQRDGWKIVVGPERQNSGFGWFSPNVTANISKTSPEMLDTECGLPRTPCLFNLNGSGMTEHKDVSAQHPDIVRALLTRFLAIGQEYHPPQKNPPVDLSGYCSAVAANDNFVGPWMNQTDSQVLL
eukprot:COSAG01_NODE_2537_length_7450_cov_5.509411_3_plen_258_part_00